MKISNSDFWILASILGTIGGVGIYEGYTITPALYSQPAIIFGGIGAFAFKAFYLDIKTGVRQHPTQRQNGRKHHRALSLERQSTVTI